LIDYFAIGLTHALLVLAAWRLLQCDDLDAEDSGRPRPRKPWLKDKPQSKDGGADA